MENPAFHRCARAAACLIACALLLAAPRAGARATPSRAFNDLNSMRVLAGVPRVKTFPGRLNRGCRMHNRYMHATGRFGHTERRGSAFYSRSGARAAAASVIAQPSALPSAAWGDTVYHRLAMLQPRLRRSGYSGSYGYACLQVLSGIGASRASRVELYSWPPNGAVGLNPVFDANESPDPLADAPGATDLGTPITVNLNGPWKNWRLARSSVTSATLVSDLGAPVPLSIADMSAANAAYLQGGFALLPRAALAENTGYTVTAQGYAVYGEQTWPFELTTRFTTGAAPY
ncbi:MAG: CAP domain-containing protein [Solirubrobacterales bacterium]